MENVQHRGKTTPGYYQTLYRNVVGKYLDVRTKPIRKYAWTPKAHSRKTTIAHDRNNIGSITQRSNAKVPVKGNRGAPVRPSLQSQVKIAKDFNKQTYNVGFQGNIASIKRHGFIPQAYGRHRGRQDTCFSVANPRDQHHEPEPTLGLHRSCLIIT